MSKSRTVFLKDEEIYATLVSYGAHTSRIKYVYGGVEYDVVVENDEIEFLEEDEFAE